MPVYFWDISDYEKQWKAGLERIKTHDASVLITAMNDLNKRAQVNWWVLYKEGDKIYIQEQMLIDEVFEKELHQQPFNKETCYNFIDPRETVTEEGHKISDWVIDLSDLE